MKESRRNFLITLCLTSLISIFLVVVLWGGTVWGEQIGDIIIARMVQDDPITPIPTRSNEVREIDDTATPVSTKDGAVRESTENTPPLSATSDEVNESTWVASENVLYDDTNWTEDVYLTGDIIVAENATLTISPGVTVFFADDQDDARSGYWEDRTELHVFGKLIARGTIDSPITFISDASDVRAGDWGGIIIRKNSTESFLSHCTIRGAEHGIRFFMDHEGSGRISGMVRNCTISDNTIGIFMRGAPRFDTRGGLVTITPTIVENTIQNNVEDGIFLHTVTGYGRSNNEATIQNNLISGNLIGINILTGSWWEGHTDTQPHITDNTIANNAQYGIFIHALGSGDTSGSDTNVTATVSHNHLQDNGAANIHLLLEPQGKDGKQFMAPEIRCNVIVGSAKGIVLTDTEDGGLLQPSITHNHFAAYASIGDSLVHNAGTREFEMHDNVRDDEDLGKWQDFCGGN